MLRRAEADRWLFVATITLCLVGAVMVFSASALTAREQYGNSYHFLLRQLLWLGFGLVAMFAMINLDYRRLRQPKLVLTYFFVVLVMLVGVFFLDKSHATHRWFHMGPVSLQPSELAKLAVILYLAWFLELRCRPRSFGVNDLAHTLAPAMTLVLMLAGLVVLEPDLGTSLRSPDNFGRFLVFGVTVMVASQALSNLGLVLGMMPTKVIPLPFMIYGGSSLFVMLLGTSVLLNISEQTGEAVRG